MKEFIFAVSMLGVCLTLTCLPVMADESIKIKTDGSDNTYSIEWNDECTRLLIDSDFVTKCFGGEVKLNNNNIDIAKNGHTLHFEFGNEFYVMDGLGGRKIDCLAEVKLGKAYVPLRYICEAFGASVQYDNVSQTVSIKPNAIAIDDSITPYIKNVQVFDQSTIRITGEKTVYIDPRRLKGDPHDADIIFITHTHNDHYEPDSIKKIIKPSTVIYITKDGVEQAKKDGFTNVIGVLPNTNYNESGTSFSTVAAYNTSPNRQNHKKEFNWVGYIININGYTYYFAGDSDFINEMSEITKPIDVAFLPIDGKYNMDFSEAAKAANNISPKVAVPYHYNNFIAEDVAVKFAELLNENIKSAILTFKMI